ncbi:sugar kinase [Paracoccus sp. SCSIO 75233]|uniref:sugar kinase n=1 Tax=Paracoccus sp. SCSIO 75233 TaxID=3017782 RepID=UPI0022F058D5|nr:sugar kinase [Paracoccus sp. SCSIO 75233]WBU53059.1 sugar kinase [Paracoccus sp. SCSIO 75233]
MVELAPLGDLAYQRGFAGDTYNTIWHIAQLLGDRVQAGFVTRVGCDGLSDSFVQGMAADGLDISGVSRDPKHNMGLYLIELDGVERSFHYWRDMSAARHLADDADALAAALKDVGLIHVSGITLAILPPSSRKTLFTVLTGARAGGAVISFDPNIRPRLWTSREEIHETVSQMAEITDIALPSFDDESAIWGDATPADTVARFAALGVAEIVVKNGAASVVVGQDGQLSEFATPAADIVRDTTGAGDSFNAGYLSARLQGAATGKAVQMGCALARVVIRNLGARAPKDEITSLAL